MTLRPSTLVGNLALYVGAPLAMNGIIFGLGWQGARSNNPMLPPGWVVGTIWMLLFAGMAVARWLIVHSRFLHSARSNSVRWRSNPVRWRSNPVRWIDALALLCLVYPLYTIGLSNEAIGLAGALVTAAVGAIAAVRLWPVARTASGLLAAVLAWLLYAATALTRDLRR